MPRRVAVTFILGLDCMIDVAEPPAPAWPEEAPAPIFAIEGPAEAVAGSRFSLNAWVYLDGDEPWEVVASAFTAEVDEAARTITVTGRVRRPEPAAARMGGPRIQRALVVGIGAVAAAGDYQVRVPSAYFTAEIGKPGAFEPDVPAPCPAWTLRVR